MSGLPIMLMFRVDNFLTNISCLACLPGGARSEAEAEAEAACLQTCKQAVMLTG
jgi:hypothetical protein